MDDRYHQHDWRAICDRCGAKRWASDLVLEWTGLRVCWEHVDRRSPQEFVRGVPDNMTVPWARPESPDVFLEVNEIAYVGDFSDDFSSDFY